MSFVGLKNENGGVRRGSALVLVIVLTVLLSSVGILFVMMSRLDEMATSSIIRNAELDAGVDAVVGKIEQVLLSSMDNDSVSPTKSNYSWLGSVEPVFVSHNDNLKDLNDDIYVWLSITDLYGGIGNLASGAWCDPDDIDDSTQWETGAWGIFGVKNGNLEAKVILPGDRTWVVREGAEVVDEDADAYKKWATSDVNMYGARADADGDGVADSRWVLVPNISGGKGENIYAAVRVVDSNAKLNLNVAHSFAADPNDNGRYLSHVDYERFLRGSDVANPNRIRSARMTDGVINTPAEYHNEALMNIENPGGLYNLFDIGDELEIANRFLLSSKVEARFEQSDVANFTFDAGGEEYIALTVPRNRFDNPYRDWVVRIDPNNFDDSIPDNPNVRKYDCRHVCTFYSFDKVWREPYTNEDILNPSAWYLTPEDSADGVGIRLGDVFMPWRGAVSVRDLAMVYPDETGTADDAEREYLLKQSRKTVLHLLYAFRAYYIEYYLAHPDGYSPAEATKMAAKRAAQYVANMIDYIDEWQAKPWEGPFGDPLYGVDLDGDGQGDEGQKNEDPTFIDHEVIKQLILEVSGDVLGAANEIDIDSGDAEDEQYDLGLEDGVIVYGYERQPFISEIVSEYDAFSVKSMVAIELVNPYDTELDLTGWRIKMGSKKFAAFGANTVIVPKGGSEPDKLGRFVIGSKDVVGVTDYSLTGLENEFVFDRSIELQRPDPANATEFITVDRTMPEQMTYLLPAVPIADETYSSKRDDRQWKFTDAKNYENDNTSNLGAENGLSGPEPTKWQMPVADDSEIVLMTLGDFEKVLSVGAERSDPNTTHPVTEFIADADPDDEGDVRFDIKESDLLDYVCLLNRAEGNLPGRININTATKEVIRAAIPPDGLWDADELAEAIVSHREDLDPTKGPFESLGDLLGVAEFTVFKGESPQIDLAGDDAAVEDDFEERDWILSRVSNIFTVRSDVFVAYILVRLGDDGPEKRVMAIFDRSNVHWPTDKPRVVAIHPVPDPR